jgi:hypothetical protein
MELHTASEIIHRNESQLQAPQHYQAGGRSLGNVTTHLPCSPFHESCIAECNGDMASLWRVLPMLVQRASNTMQSEQVGSTGNASSLYSEGAPFESRPDHRLFHLKFSVVFPSPSRQILG